MIKVHGVSLSPFARKVLFGLEYKEITYEQIPVFPGDDSEAFSAIRAWRYVSENTRRSPGSPPKERARRAERRHCFAEPIRITGASDRPRCD